MYFPTEVSDKLRVIKSPASCDGKTHWLTISNALDSTHTIYIYVYSQRSHNIMQTSPKVLNAQRCLRYALQHGNTHNNACSCAWVLQQNVSTMCLSRDGMDKHIERMTLSYLYVVCNVYVKEKLWLFCV